MTNKTPQSGVSPDTASAGTVEPRGSTRVEALFENLNERGQEPSLGRTTGVYEFDIEGSGQWFLKLSKGAVLVRPSESVSEHLEWRPVPGWRERCVEDDEVGRREL